MNKEPKDPLLLDHEADGIRELDNNLPRWWVWLFVLCTVFAVGYIVYYHVLKVGPLQAAEYQAEATRGDALKNAALARFESDVATLKPLTDTVALEQGKQSFVNLCAPCHRADGGAAQSQRALTRDGAADRSHRGGLAGAVGPQHHHDLTLVDRHVDAVQHRDGSVAGGQPLSVQQRHDVLPR